MSAGNAEHGMLLSVSPGQLYPVPGVWQAAACGAAGTTSLSGPPIMPGGSGPPMMAGGVMMM